MTTYNVDLTTGYSEEILGPYVNVGVVVPAIGTKAGDQVVLVVDEIGQDWTSQFLPVVPADDTICHYAYSHQCPGANMKMVGTLEPKAV